MKRLLLIIASSVVLLTGCTKENVTLSNNEGELQSVTFTTALENGVTTKAVADGDGAAAKVNRCIMEVYYADTLYTRMYAKVTDKKASFTTQMVSNRTYTVAFWADCVDDPNSESGLLADKYYTTNATGGLRAIALKGTYIGNDDARDAFFHAGSYEVKQAGSSYPEVKLKRPFAQMNVITTDWDKVSFIETLKPEKVNVTLKAPLVKFNAVTGEASADSGVPTLNYEAALYASPAAVSPVSATDKTLSMDYLFASAAKEVMDIDWKALHGTDPNVEHTFASVPYQRNYRTNIKGALLTTIGKWDVEILPAWDTPDTNIKVYVATIDDIASLNSVLASDEAKAADEVTVTTTMPTDSDTEVVVFTTANNEQVVNLTFTGTLGTNNTITFQNDNESTTQGPANLNIVAPAETKLIFNNPLTHVVINGTSYASVSGTFSANSLIIPKDVTVDNLSIAAGGLEIHGTVKAVTVTGTAETVFVRDCEGLSSTVYEALKPYIASGYMGVEISGKYDIVPKDIWTNYASKSFSAIDESAKTLTISTPAELALFAKTLNEKGSFAGYTVTIAQDLDMSAHYWTPISAYGCGNISSATIQGPGKIKNLKINTAVTPAASATSLTYGAGFIGIMDGNITFKDITFDNADVDVYNGSQVAVIVGMHYATATFENVKVTNSTVRSCTKSGIMQGQTDNKAIVKNCSVINSKIYASYSYALMVGLVNTISSIEFEGDNMSTGSTAIYDYSRCSDGEYASKITIKGYEYGVEDTDLWVCGVQNALAEQRISPIPQKTISGTTYGIRGSKFYYNDKVVDIMQEAQPGTFNVSSAAELKDCINEINTSAATGQFTVELAAGTYDMEGVDILQKEGKQFTITAVTSADVTVSYPDAGTTGYIFKVTSTSSYKPNANIKFKDIKFSSKAATAFTTGAAEERYVNDIDFINCEFTTSAGATPVTSPNNSQPSGLYFENCKVTNGSGYLYSGYGNNLSTARGYAVKAVGCTAPNCKHFINVQNDGQVIVDGCTVTNYADYAIRTNGGNITVIDTDFICTDKTTTANGLLVVRQSNATVTVDTLSTFNKENAGTGIHDVQCGSDITITIAGRATGSISGNGTTYDFPNE